MATGLPRKTRAMSAGGRDSQSTAFFATPGRLEGNFRDRLDTQLRPSGMAVAAARSSAELNEARRRLPEMPMRVVTRL